MVEVLSALSHNKKYFECNGQEEYERETVVTTVEWVSGHEDELLDQQKYDTP